MEQHRNHMMRRRHGTWLWPAALSACLVALATGRAAAQQDITLQLNSILRLSDGKWTQMTANLFNSTETDRIVEVTYTTNDPTRGEVRFVRRVILPAKSRAFAWFAAKPGKLIRTGAGNSVRVSAEVSDADTRVLLYRDTELPKSAVGERQRLIAIIDAAGVAYTYLSASRNQPEEQGQAAQDTPDISGKFPNAAGARISPLPDGWYGYAAAEVVVVGKLDLAECRESQLLALIDYVTNGGVLVIAADAGTDQLMQSPLGRLAGVDVAGSSFVKQIEVSPATRGKEPTVVFDQPVRLLNMTPREAQVIATADGAPLMTRQHVGLGTVFVVAVPGDALGHPGLGNLWLQVDNALRLPRPVYPDRFEEASYASLTEIAGQRGALRWQILLWLGGFAVITLGVGVAMRLRGRGELTWVLMIPLAILLSIGLYVSSRLRSPDASTSYVGMMIGDGQNRAIVQASIGYYSPDTMTLNLPTGSDNGDGAAYAIGSAASSGTALTIIDSTDGVVVRDAMIAANSVATFQSGAPIDLPGRLEMDLHYGDGGLEGTITNKTGMDLTGAVFLIAGRAYAIGDLPAGATTNVAAGTGERKEAGDFIPAQSLVKSDQDLRRNLFIRAMTRPPEKIPPRPFDTDPNPRVILMGWASANPLQPFPGKSLPQAGDMLMIENVLPAPTTPGVRVVLPPEMVSLQHGKASPPVMNFAGEFSDQNTANGLNLLIRPPDEVGRVTDTKVALRVGLRAPDWELTILGIAPDGSDETLQTFSRPGGENECIIDNADRFMTDDGTVRIGLRVNPVGGGSDPSTKRASWKFQYIEPTLEGTVK